MKLKLSNNYALKQKYDGKTTAMTPVDQEEFGMKIKDNWYGGNLKRMAQVVNSPVVVLMNSELKTIDVGYIIGREDELSQEDAEMFGVVTVEQNEKKDSEPPKKEAEKTVKKAPSPRKR